MILSNIVLNVDIWIADYGLDELETQVTRYKPEGLDSLCRNTKFTRQELQVMYRGFKQVPSHTLKLGTFLMRKLRLNVLLVDCFIFDEGCSRCLWGALDVEGYV